MPTSTVLDAVSSIPAAKVEELRRILSTDANKEKRILLVEGPDDKKLYSRFINDGFVLINVLESCYYMADILVLINADGDLNERVIGIKDADFDHITGPVVSLDNLFITDTHDWETMVMTEDCENNIAMEVLERRERGLFNRVMSDLLNYSYIKLYNIIEICKKGFDGIKFSGFSLLNIYNGNDPCQIDVCLSAIRSYANNSLLSHFPTIEDINRLKTAFPSLDFRQISCGHDVIHGVVYRLAYLNGGSTSVGKTDVERLLRTSCTMIFFKTTSLYQMIAQWAESHSTTVWAA